MSELYAVLVPVGVSRGAWMLYVTDLAAPRHPNELPDRHFDGDMMPPAPTVREAVLAEWGYRVLPSPETGQTWRWIETESSSGRSHIQVSTRVVALADVAQEPVEGVLA